MKPILLLGGSGATGRLVMQELLHRKYRVRAVVRDRSRLPAALAEDDHLECIEQQIATLSAKDWQDLLEGCDTAVSCLGHRLGLQGIWGPPYRLVTEAVKHLVYAADERRSSKPLRMILMSSSGVRNHRVHEQVSPAERVVLGLIRCLVPPHADNEQAAAYLATRTVMDDPCLEWVAVRPDSLVDAREPSPYSVHGSPIRSAIFNAGKTSRINVAHFMVELIANQELWQPWKGRMPVVYNENKGNGE